MKSQFLFICLFVSVHGFVLGMESPVSPKSTVGLISPATVVHQKCLSNCKDPVHQVRNHTRQDDEFEHTVETFCVVISARSVENLTSEQQAAAVHARYQESMKPKGSCIKY